MNVEQARFNMIEQQIRPWNVLDLEVLSLLSVVRREEFVPPAYRALAFTDMPVPLPEESVRWWGTGKLVEFAAGLSDVSVLYQLVSSVRRETCHWCGLELIGDRCGFCAAPLREPEPPPVRALPRAVT